MKNSKRKKIINNLGAKATILLFCIAFITLSVNFILNSVFVFKNFSDIEKSQVSAKTEQSRKIFKSRIKEIEKVVEDYSFWDENYVKVQEEHTNEEWYKANFIDWLPEQFGLDLIVVLNKDKKVIVQHGLNSISEILNDNKLLQSLNDEKYDETRRVSGFKKYDGEMYLISECPILNTSREGNSQGVVIVGKKINSSFVTKIKEDFGDDIFITNNNKIVSNDEISKEVNENTADIYKNIDKPVYMFNNNKIIGSSPIVDYNGNKIGKLNIVMSRDTFLSTQKLTKRNVLIAMGISIIAVLLLGWKFNKSIVKPIENLENQIKNMEIENLLMHTYIDKKAPNEILNLSESFNHMIDSLNDHKKENSQLKIYANTDYLTSVYNHKYFFECFNQNLAEGQKQISIMFCDIDKFKVANDSYGHEVGDFLLREVAKTIKHEVKDAGIVFRYGGEEFVVMMCSYTSEQTLVQAEKLRESIAKNKELQRYGEYFPITISIGIASYPNHALDAEGLIKKADSAMYYSKQNGRNQCNIYNKDMNVFLSEDNKDTKKELLMDSVLALAEAVDAKDDYTGKHSKLVSKYAVLLADKLGFTEKEKNRLRVGALLHDCGKIGIPDNIIHKPVSLTDNEYAIIKNHTLLGYNIIKHITDDEAIINCVRSHHERWDGKGYPDGISGDAIHLFARIVCIADVYHAMTSDRPYRRALTQEKAIEEFRRGKGTQFDPKLVEAFIETIEENVKNTDINKGA